VKLAGERAVLDDAEPGEVGLQVRAAALQDPVAQGDVLSVGGALALVVPAAAYCNRSSQRLLKNE
jgi:hypothetical protein